MHIAVLLSTFYSPGGSIILVVGLRSLTPSCSNLTDQLMMVIKSISDDIDQSIATNQIGHHSLCQTLDLLISKHLSMLPSTIYCIVSYCVESNDNVSFTFFLKTKPNRRQILKTKKLVFTVYWQFLDIFHCFSVF